MKKEPTKQKSISELRELEIKATNDALKVRLEIKGGKTKNTRALFNLRKELARTKTNIRNLELLELNKIKA